MLIRQLISGTLVLGLISQPASMALAATPPTEMALPAKAIGLLLTVNSSMSVEKALESSYSAEDFKEIKNFLNQKGVDLSVPMSDTPVVDGKIFYGKKQAEIRDDLSVKVNGTIVRYEPSQTPAQNYIRIFKIFEGQSSATSAMLKQILPSAEAQTGAEIDASFASRLSGGSAVDSAKAFAEAGKLRTLEALRVQGVVVKDAQGKLIKLAGQATVEAAKSAGAATANAAKAAGTAAANATSAAAKASVNAAKVAGTAIAETSAASWAATKAAGSVAARAGAALLGGPVGTVAGIVGLAYSGNQVYQNYWNGRFYCGPKDGQGHSPFIFNYKSDKTTAYWEHSEQRTFTADEMAIIFGGTSKNQCEVQLAAKKLPQKVKSPAKPPRTNCDGDDLVNSCEDNTAEAFTATVKKVGEDSISVIKETTFDAKGKRKTVK
jgi:hypothetical protein